MSRASSLLAVLTPTEVREFLPEPLLTQLRGLVPEFRLIDPTGMSEAAFGIELARINPDIVLGCWKTPPLPEALPSRLRYVCYITGSVKKMISRAHLERGLIVSNWGGSISRTVAEAALFHMLACLRNASHWAIAMHQPGTAAWKNGLTDARSLFRRSVGIHGFGPVARELVGLLKPWGCPTTAFAPDLTAELAHAYGVERAASLDALFAENEIIVELAPLIPATTGLITERLLRLIRPGGVFVNVGRGAVVDEAALLRVARDGRISIGLDVYTTEPLPADSGFRSLPRVSLTPHTAGPTIDRYPDAGAFAVKNLRAHVEGRPLEAVITPEIYDQSS
ncbi:hydroxyacid dehydrogenase [Horticoccus sp. 23ND18S-11]|uniref:hydroxyacid dehydrogenase n=1 Tax=Horticoccus sp. 23ND18S-11 TaxID=3391832 RepID=UPI0039C9ED58